MNRIFTLATNISVKRIIMSKEVISNSYLQIAMRYCWTNVFITKLIHNNKSYVVWSLEYTLLLMLSGRCWFDSSIIFETGVSGGVVSKSMTLIGVSNVLTHIRGTEYKTHLSVWLCAPMSLPQQPRQTGKHCLKIQIRPNHLLISVRTVSPSDSI